MGFFDYDDTYEDERRKQETKRNETIQNLKNQGYKCDGGYHGCYDFTHPETHRTVIVHDDGTVTHEF